MSRLTCMKLMAVCLTAILFSSHADSANRGVVLHPDDAKGLRTAGIAVKHEILNRNEHAFTITAEVPEGFKSLDAMFQVRNDKGLTAYSAWESTSGKVVAVFMVGEAAIKDAVFTVHHHKGDRSAPFGERTAYGLRLAEFAGVTSKPKAMINDQEFSVSALHSKGGATLTVALKRKMSFSNHHYDCHITSSAGLDQRFEIRSGTALTAKDVRLVDLSADGYLDIMIVGGQDHRGADWFRTLLYDPESKKFQWINDR